MDKDIDIDELMNYINEDENLETKKKSKKKKKDIKTNLEQIESTSPIDKNTNNPENTNKPEIKNEELPSQRENKYRDKIQYSPNQQISPSPLQSNSHLRLINSWSSSSPSLQTTPPTKSIDDQYPQISQIPAGQILEYSNNLIWRSTSLEKKQKENEYKYQIENMRKSAECHRQIRKYAQSLLHPGIKLLDFCIQLELMLKFITNANGTECGQAFPTGCSLNNIAAHYTPSSSDNTILTYDDVCKIDFGTHFNGFLIDCAFTVAFNPIYDNLLKASKEGTNEGIKLAGIDARLGEIGERIQEVIESYEIELNGKVHKIKPVRNLCGHTITQYHVHGGKSVPIVKSNDDTKMEEGEFYAIETFASTGKGYVKEVGGCSHYMKDEFAFNNTKIKQGQPRALFKFIDKHFTTLAFCPRWIEEKGFVNYQKPLKFLCDLELVNKYPPLADIDGSYVAQFEHTLMLRPTCKEVFSVGEDY